MSPRFSRRLFRLRRRRHRLCRRRRRHSLGGRRLLGNASLQVSRRKAAALRDDAGNQIGRRHIKRRIPASDAGRRNTMLTDVRHLAIRPLLDDDVIAARNGQIDGRQRRGHIERHAVVASNAGDLVGADFVGRVAVGGNLNEQNVFVQRFVCRDYTVRFRSYPIGAHNDGGDFPVAQQSGHHAVEHQRCRQFVVHQFVGGQTSALIVRTRFSAVDVLWMCVWMFRIIVIMRENGKRSCVSQSLPNRFSSCSFRTTPKAVP